MYENLGVINYWHTLFSSLGYPVNYFSVICNQINVLLSSDDGERHQRKSPHLLMTQIKILFTSKIGCHEKKNKRQIPDETSLAEDPKAMR